MRFWIAAALVVVSAPALALPLHPTGRAVVAQSIEEVIRPGFEAYAVQTRALVASVGADCGVSAERLEALRTQFKAVVTAWSQVELYRVGPLLEEDRSDRTLFWPDRKGIALKQVQQILASEDATALDPLTLRGKSVAVQGLGALEFVLFGTGSDEMSTGAAAFRCHYGEAIARLLDQTAWQLVDAWEDQGGISTRLTFPSDMDPEFRDDDEVRRALVGLLAHGVEAIRDQRILPFLGREGEPSKPKSAPFWRSGMTMGSVVANFEGLKRLFEASELGAYLPSENAEIGVKILAGFDAILSDAALVTGRPSTARWMMRRSVRRLSGLLPPASRLARCWGRICQRRLGCRSGSRRWTVTDDVAAPGVSQGGGGRVCGVADAQGGRGAGTGRSDLCLVSADAGWRVCSSAGR